MHHALARAVRALARKPVFVLATVTILSLGIGATTAMFALVNTVLLRPLAYPAAARLVSLGSRMSTDPVFSGMRLGLSDAQYFFIRNASRTLEDIGAYDSNARQATLSGDGSAERVSTAYVTSSLFSVLGLTVDLGHAITRQDDLPGARGSVAVLGHDLWISRYGSDPGILGTVLTLDGQQVTVIGVMTRGVQLPGRGIDIWLPLGADPSAPARNHHYLSTVARIQDGESLDTVRREMMALTSQLQSTFPNVYASAMMQQAGFMTDAIPLKDTVVGNAGRILWSLLGAVGLVLAISCVNVANLFLVRAHTRRRESAIRAALGAGYVHLARQYTLESILIAGLAGVIGVLLAITALHLFVIASPWDIPRLDEVRFGSAAIVITVAVVLALGITFGVLQLAGLSSLSTALHEEGRGTTLSRSQQTIQRVFVAGQVAMAVVLLAASGIMIRSVLEIRAVQPGFNSTGVISMVVSLPETRYRTEEDASTTWRGLTQRLESLPGVTLAAATQHAPLDGESTCSGLFVEGRTTGGPEEPPPCVQAISVTPGYFETLQIPVRGSTPNWQDVEALAEGVVVSEALAERLWPNENPIGKGVKAHDGEPPYYRVIGVAGDVHGDGLDMPPIEAAYFPTTSIADAPLWGPLVEMTVLVRVATGDPTLLAPAMRQAVAYLEPDAPVTQIRTLDTIVAAANARIDFITLILVVAAAMALLLSGVGLYTVIAYVTSQRRAEIAIRLALGAQSGQIFVSIIAQSVALAFIGIILGLLGAIAMARVMRSLVGDIVSNDPRVLAVTSLLIILAAALAGYIPARRAARLQPTEALR